MSDEPIVKITWKDAWYDADYVDESDFADEFVIETVGFLVRRGEHAISIATERQPEEGKARWRGVTHIPWPMVVSVEELGTPGPAEVHVLRPVPTE